MCRVTSRGNCLKVWGSLLQVQVGEQHLFTARVSLLYDDITCIWFFTWVRIHHGIILPRMEGLGSLPRVYSGAGLSYLIIHPTATNIVCVCATVYMCVQCTCVCSVYVCVSTATTTLKGLITIVGSGQVCMTPHTSKSCEFLMDCHTFLHNIHI